MNHINAQDLNPRGTQIPLTNFSIVLGRIRSITQSVIIHFDIRLSISIQNSYHKPKAFIEKNSLLGFHRCGLNLNCTGSV